MEACRTYSMPAPDENRADIRDIKLPSIVKVGSCYLVTADLQ